MGSRHAEDGTHRRMRGDVGSRAGVRGVVVAAFLTLCCACGGGGGGGGGAPPHDFSGLWILSETDDDTNCGGDVHALAPYLATVEQVGAALTITTPSGVFIGTVSGDVAVVSGTYRDGIGYTTFTSWALNSQPSGFDGNVVWTYSLDPSGVPIDCHGTSVISGVLAPPPITVASTPLPAVETGEPVSQAMAIGGACGGPYTAQLVGGALPNGVSFAVDVQPGNASFLSISGTPRESGFYVFDILVSDPGCLFANNKVVSFTWAIAQGPLMILDCNPPLIPAAGYDHPLKYTDVDALADTIFNRFVVYNFGLVGGTPPYALEVINDPADPDDGDLPVGLSIPSNSASITGAAVQEEVAGRPFRVTFRATDAGGGAAIRKFQIGVLTPSPIIVTTSLPSATKDVFYSQTVAVSDGVPPFVYTISAGALPAGLTINSGTGAISGTPTATGTANFTVQVANQLASGSATKDLSITVN